MEILIPYCLLILSIALFILFTRLLSLKKTHSKLLLELQDLRDKQVKSKNFTIEAQQILHDLTTHGSSIVKISPISPTEVFWRSPK